MLSFPVLFFNLLSIGMLLGVLIAVWRVRSKRAASELFVAVLFMLVWSLTSFAEMVSYTFFLQGTLAECLPDWRILYSCCHLVVLLGIYRILERETKTDREDTLYLPRSRYHLGRDRFPAPLDSSLGLFSHLFPVFNAGG